MLSFYFCNFSNVRGTFQIFCKDKAKIRIFFCLFQDVMAQADLQFTLIM